jgi:hypothetical protein
MILIPFETSSDIARSSERRQIEADVNVSKRRTVPSPWHFRHRVQPQAFMRRSISCISCRCRRGMLRSCPSSALPS